MDMAVPSLDLDCFKWIVGANFPWLEIRYSPDAMTRAAREGCLELVQLLYEAIGCWHVGPMDEAAGDGHLAVVKWLHRNAGNCSTLAMDWAADGGHLAMVKWLHTHRSVGCTAHAMD